MQTTTVPPVVESTTTKIEPAPVQENTEANVEQPAAPVLTTAESVSVKPSEILTTIQSTEST